MWKLLFKKYCWKTCFLVFIKKKCVWYHNLNNVFQHLKNIKNVFGTCVYFCKKNWSYVRNFFFFNLDSTEKRGEMRWQYRGEETKFKKKADQWVHQQSKKLSKCVQVYYVIAIRNVSSLFKITSGHISKHIVQTLVFQQQFSNNSILNWQTKHIFLPFEH